MFILQYLHEWIYVYLLIMTHTIQHSLFIWSDHFDSASTCWKILKCVEKEGQRRKINNCWRLISKVSLESILKEVKFSPWIFEIFDICLHTRLLYRQNVLKFIDQHLAQSSTSVLFQKIGFLYYKLTQYLMESCSNIQVNGKKKIFFHNIFENPSFLFLS